jgi:hypothetical protein
MATATTNGFRFENEIRTANGTAQVCENRRVLHEGPSLTEGSCCKWRPIAAGRFD